MSMPSRLSAKKPKITVEEYLRRERAAEDRHMYLDGEIIAKAGESGEHGDISTNVVGLLHAQLKGKPCRARTKDTKVHSGADRPHGSSTKGLFSYPDVVVICGEPVYHDEHHDVIINPTVIIEVLSPTTEAYDRGVKFVRLRNWNESLREYVLVSQAEPLVEIYRRGEGTAWSFEPFAALSAVVPLLSIGCELPLADVYDRIEFRPAENAASDGQQP